MHTFHVSVLFPDRDNEDVAYEIVVGDSRASYVLSHSVAKDTRRSGPVKLLAPTYIDRGYPLDVSLKPDVAAPAYEVYWAKTEEAYRAGDLDSFVVPANVNQIFGWTNLVPRIDLGRMNGVGRTMPLELIQGGVWFGVTARFDLGFFDDAPAEPYFLAGFKPWVFIPPDGLVAKANAETPLTVYAITPTETTPTMLNWQVLGALLLGLFFGVLLASRMKGTTAATLDAASVPQLGLLAAAFALVLCQIEILTSSGIRVGLIAVAVGAVASVLAASIQHRR